MKVQIPSVILGLYSYQVSSLVGPVHMPAYHLWPHYTIQL